MRTLTLSRIKATLVLAATVACNPDSPRDGIGVIVRPCVVRGSPWSFDSDGKPTTAASADIADVKVNEALEATSEVWTEGAGVGFIALPNERTSGHVPLIDDPFPPGVSGDVDYLRGPGKLGDSVQQYLNTVTFESDAVVAACNAAWHEEGKPLLGIPIVFVRSLVREDGHMNTELAAFGPPVDEPYQRNGGIGLCAKPYQILTSDVADRWVVMPTVRAAGSLPLSRVLAHELGHVLLLEHGDGLDNDGDGVWDRCDTPRESSEMQSLMSISAAAENITLLQRELARAAAMKVPGTIGGPP